MSNTVQMQSGWYRNRGREIVLALCRIPDVVNNVTNHWIIINKNGIIYRISDLGRYISEKYDSDIDVVEHLPDCTGFDWVPIIRSKTPQVGEWWRNTQSGTILHISGMSMRGEPIWENGCGQYNACGFWYGWQHEPECTGFDWKPNR